MIDAHLSTSTATVEDVIDAIEAGSWSLNELARIDRPAAVNAKNNTEIIGQHGKVLTARVFDARLAPTGEYSFEAYTSTGQRLQVKTFAEGGKPVSNKRFDHDVITVNVDLSSAEVLPVRPYKADDLRRSFDRAHETKCRPCGMTAAPDGAFDPRRTIARPCLFLRMYVARCRQCR